jgi:transposase
LELPQDISSLTALVYRLLERIEKLEADNAQLKADNAALRAENASLKAENKELKARLAQNSSNSHKPPSGEGYHKKPALPKATGKKQGGQPGHRGNTLQMACQVDQVVECKPQVCSCGATLSAGLLRVVESRQVFDLPQPKLEVIEYRRMSGSCAACGAQGSGSFPSQVIAPVQYGPGVAALAVLLNNACQVSFQKVSVLFSDLFGCPINTATLLKANRQVYESLEQSEQLIKEGLKQAQVAHFDETGIRVEGRLHWLHTCANQDYSYLFVDCHRGQQALRSEKSILADFTGWAVHDCLGAYFTFSNCKHSVCGAHLLRELEALIEAGSLWAISMKELLLSLYEHSKQGKDRVGYFAYWQALYHDFCQQGLREEPLPEGAAKAKPKKTKGRNLLDRLLKYKDPVLAFAQYKVVPFTNNQAERDLRPAKGKLKVAGCFRTCNGAATYARIQGFIATCRKQQQNLFHQLKNALSGHTFLTNPALAT